MRLFLPLLLVLNTLQNCQKSQPPLPRPTVELNRFLSEHFGRTLPDTLHYFVFMPNNACKGCIRQTMDFAKKGVLKPNVTFIYLTEAPMDADSNLYLLADPADVLLYRFFAQAYVVYKIRNREIESILYPNALEIPDFFMNHGLLNDTTLHRG